MGFRTGEPILVSVWFSLRFLFYTPRFRAPLETDVTTHNLQKSQWLESWLWLTAYPGRSGGHLETADHNPTSFITPVSARSLNPSSARPLIADQPGDQPGLAAHQRIAALSGCAPPEKLACD